MGHETTPRVTHLFEHWAIHRERHRVGALTTEMLIRVSAQFDHLVPDPRHLVELELLLEACEHKQRRRLLAGVTTRYLSLYPHLDIIRFVSFLT